MILPMARVRLVGPRDLLDRALAFLQVQGVMEVRAPSEGGPVRLAPTRVALLEEEARLEAQRSRAESLLERLPHVQGARVPAGRQLPPAGSAALGGWLDGVEEALSELTARRVALVEEREAAERFGRLIVALAPLHHGLDPALEPEIHGLVLTDDPEALALLGGEMRRIAGEACEMVSRPLDADHMGVLLVVPRSKGRALSALLFERGVEELKLPASCTGPGVFDVLVKVAERTRRIPLEIAEVDERLAELAVSVRPPLAEAARAAAEACDRDRTAERCGETRFVFVVAGYMAAERVGDLRAAAAAELGSRVSVLAEPAPRQLWEEVPVVLRNLPAVRPFERLLALLPLPRYGSVDPTPWLAVFFPVFFGLVLGDVVFGVLGIAASLLVRVRGLGGALGRDLSAVALACSASAAAFGLAFGEALGELGAHLGLHPLLLDRRRAVLAFLAVALAVGTAHLLVGMALGVTSAARAGRRREAMARLGRLVVVPALAAAAGAATGILPRSVLVPAFAVAGAALLGAMLAEGPLAALDVLLGLGNILSYSRLMALGLASVLLAEVANLVAGSLRPVAAGVALAVLLHAVNFSLGLVSPVIASLRLHYVEFFEKFYDAGGSPFRPFARAT